MTKIEALRKFFQEGKHGRELKLQELKEVSKEDREELGELALKEFQDES